MKLVRSKFKRWLKTKSHNEVVGSNRDCHSCPIARYYFEATGGCEVVISDHYGDYYIDRGDGSRLVPHWAAQFIFSVDGIIPGTITAGKALSILDGENS